MGTQRTREQVRWEVFFQHNNDTGSEDELLREAITAWNAVQDEPVEDYASGYDFTTGKRDVIVGEFDSYNEGYKFAQTVMRDHPGMFDAEIKAFTPDP